MNLIKNLRKGYNRPVSMPRWKHFIIWIIWIIAFCGYVSAMFITPWFLILGIIFQQLGLYLPHIWDTGNWRKTKMGEDFINKYGE